MANALREELTGRYVVIDESTVTPAYKDIRYRVLLVNGGFGASANTRGSAVFGRTPYDGETMRVEGEDIERFATDEEIALVTRPAVPGQFAVVTANPPRYPDYEHLDAASMKVRLFDTQDEAIEWAVKNPNWITEVVPVISVEEVSP